MAGKSKRTGSEQQPNGAGWWREHHDVSSSLNCFLLLTGRLLFYGKIGSIVTGLACLWTTYGPFPQPHKQSHTRFTYNLCYFLPNFIYQASKDAKDPLTSTISLASTCCLSLNLIGRCMRWWVESWKLINFWRKQKLWGNIWRHPTLMYVYGHWGRRHMRVNAP